jgi:broad specificity phosphatase PhoE
MTKYYIFRHGETLYSKNNLSYPDDSFAIEILPESIPILEKMAEYLKNTHPDYSVSSEYIRCQQSIKIISEISGLEFAADSRLNELGHNNEMFTDFKERLISFVSDIDKKHYKNVVICTHGAVISAVKRILKGIDFERGDLSDYPRTGVILCIENGKVEEIDFNKP